MKKKTVIIIVLVLAVVGLVIYAMLADGDGNIDWPGKSSENSGKNTEKSAVPTEAVYNTVTFGHYEQDNNLDNGPEPIEWIVLDRQDGKALLLSRYALDAKPYNTEYVDITWEQCTLRGWLNHDFLNAAFTKKEQSAILTTHVDNSQDHSYAAGGNNTEDQIFLLSYHEAFDQYFENNRDRICPLTEYAVAAGAYADTDCLPHNQPAGAWWLRSPGTDQNCASRVYFNGTSAGFYCDRFEAVRPALWVDLESGII